MGSGPPGAGGNGSWSGFEHFTRQVDPRLCMTNLPSAHEREHWHEHALCTNMSRLMCVEACASASMRAQSNHDHGRSQMFAKYFAQRFLGSCCPPDPLPFPGGALPLQTSLLTLVHVLFVMLTLVHAVMRAPLHVCLLSAFGSVQRLFVTPAWLEVVTVAG